MRILAVDYGARRTGLAVSDATGTLARPIEMIERIGSARGMAALIAIVLREQPALIIVGLPRTLSGQRGGQASVTEAFVGRLRQQVNVPVELEDERFTTTIAQRAPTPSPHGLDSRAAAVLLQGVLDRRAAAV